MVVSGQDKISGHTPKLAQKTICFERFPFLTYWPVIPMNLAN